MAVFNIAKFELACEGYRNYTCGVVSLSDEEVKAAAEVLPEVARFLRSLGPEHQLSAKEIARVGNLMADFHAHRKEAKRTGVR